MTNTFELIERTVCAGIEVTPTGKGASETIEELFAELNGQVGDVSDKSVQLLFATAIDRDRFRREAGALGLIFD